MEGPAVHYAFMEYTFFDWICILTALLAPLPTLIGTIKSWWARELGAGARRPEPTVAALLANACGFLFGITESLLEPFVLNLVGGVIQIVRLLVFLLVNTDGEMLEALIICITFAWMHFPMAMAVGMAHIQPLVYQFICTFAGLVAAAAPLCTYLFLLENPTAQLLPHWALMAFYTAHGLVWSARGWKLDNKFMMAQNGLGALCWAIQLMLRLTYRKPRIQEDTHGLREWLLAGLPMPEHI